MAAGVTNQKVRKVIAATAIAGSNAALDFAAAVTVSRDLCRFQGLGLAPRMPCWESDGEEFLQPEAEPPEFCVVGEGELFVDEACFAPTDVDDFDSSEKGESGMGLEDTGVPETADNIQDSEPVCGIACGKRDCCS
ncbi:unnamed protein product [Sphagnum compactum]